MKTFVKEIFKFPRYRMDFGWGNGYIIIPKGHPLYNKTCSEINDLIPTLKVHGGLTSARSVNSIDCKELPKGSKGGWIIGFHTAHYGDSLTKWSKEAVIKETEELKKQLIEWTKNQSS